MEPIHIYNESCLSILIRYTSMEPNTISNGIIEDYPGSSKKCLPKHKLKVRLPQAGIIYPTNSHTILRVQN